MANPLHLRHLVSLPAFTCEIKIYKMQIGTESIFARELSVNVECLYLNPTLLVSLPIILSTTISFLNTSCFLFYAYIIIPFYHTSPCFSTIVIFSLYLCFLFMFLLKISSTKTLLQFFFCFVFFFVYFYFCVF